MSNYDALRKIINHEANQDDDGGFFAKLYGLPEGQDDGPTARGLFQHMNFNRNSYVYQYEPEIMPKKTWLDHMIDAFKPSFKPKRQPIIAIRKDPDSPYYPWIWSCQICPGEPDLGKNFDKCVDWQSALIHASNHARNHHRSDS